MLVDGEPVRSCRMPIEAVAGKKIVTIEGLAENGELHPVQKAFMQHDALQCGYCTPGMILEVAAFLRKNARPARGEIVNALNRNLCRCGSRPRAAAVVKIRSGVDKSGRLVLWDYHVYFAGDRGAAQFYAVPHHSTVSHGGGWGGAPGAHPFGTGAWRAPANNTNTFARESQIDIMAAKTGVDPVAFRRENLDDARMLGVVNAVAERFGWKPGKAPTGRGQGIACGTDSGTCVALAAEVDVDRATGAVTVKRVACAQDMGLCINPEGATIQMEGCITMGLGYALAEEVRFEGGGVLDRNFGTYKIPRFSWVPEIDAFLIDAKDAPPQGGGEPAIIAVGAVIANAIFDATGARVFQLPMTPERVKKAIESG